jgi:hypothetical protein
VLIERDQQAVGSDQVRCGVQQALALPEGLADQADLAVLQVADPAVDEAAGGARGAGAQVLGVDQDGAQPAQDGVPGGRRAVDSGADHDEVCILGGLRHQARHSSLLMGASKHELHPANIEATIPGRW